jgi:succinate-acetate transporter protein
VSQRHRGRDATGLCRRNPGYHIGMHTSGADDQLRDRVEVRSPGPPATHDETPLDRVVVTLRPLGSPVSLGLFGLAAATFTLAGLQLGWVRPAEGTTVGLLLLGFAAPSQLLASVLAFVARDAVVGTAMAVLSLTWLTAGLVLATSAPGARSQALGLLLLVSAVAVGLTGVTGTLSKLATGAVLLTAAVRIGLTGVFQLSGQEWLKTTSGVLGVLLAVLAVAVAWGSELEDAGAPFALPLGRRGKGRDAVQGSLREQVSGVATEPGVRTRL